MEQLGLATSLSFGGKEEGKKTDFPPKDGLVASPGTTTEKENQIAI